MKITKDGWAEMEHPADDVPAAMHNAMEMRRRKTVACCFCGREMGAFEGFWVSVPGWHRHAFTCGHETKYECPECAEKNNLNGPFAECSQCGCGEEFT